MKALKVTKPGGNMDDRLAAIIKQVESSGDPHAIRFEPMIWDRISKGAFSAAVQKAHAVNVCSWGTAQMICATSWGFYQIMGFNLYGQGLASKVIDFLGDDGAQTAALSRFLNGCGQAGATWDAIVADEDRRIDFISAYNGPGNVDAYWSAMQRAAGTLALT